MAALCPTQCGRTVLLFLVTTAAVLNTFLSVAGAATYFIDYASGSNSNIGTNSASPWKHCPGDINATGTPAVTTFSPGDIVRFKGGVAYMGEILLRWSGSASALITYDGNSSESWGTGKAIVDCAFALNAAAMKLQSGVSNVRIDNFELRNAGGYAADDPVVINAANGVYGNSTGAIRTPRDGWGIYMAGPNSNIFCANLYIHHIGIWHSTVGWDGRSISGTGILLKSPDSVTISNCEITKVGATGIGLYSVTKAHNILITDCYIHDDIPNWGIDIAPQAVGAVLSGITITKTRLIDLWSDWTGTPDDPNGTGTSAPHQNYIFFRASVPSTWVDVTVTRCYFGETSDTHTGTGGTGAVFINGGPSVDIYNNVFARNWSTTATIPLNYPAPSAMTQVVRIYNNTFLRGSGTTVVSNGNNIVGRKLYIANNLFINDTGLPSSAAMIATPNVNDYPTVLNNNIYWSPDWSESQMYIAVMSGYRRLVDVKALGFESGGSYTNPRLADIANAAPILRDFHLTSASPALGRAAVLNSMFTIDRDGALRGARWDIGALEYSGAPIHANVQISP